MRIMGLDLGETRIGVALSDELLLTAQGLCVINSRGIVNDLAQVVELIEAHAVTELVIGLPRNMDGSYGFQAQITREFADAVLAKWDGDHAFQDERLTTASARRVLIEADVSRDKRKQVIDKVAAVVILQGYLDAHGNT